MTLKQSPRPGVSHVKVLLRMTRPGSRYAHDLFDVEGNLILKAHNPLSQALINHLLSGNTEVLYYDPKSHMDLPEAGLNTATQAVSSETVDSAVNTARTLFDDIRDQLNYSPEATISKARINETRGVIGKMLKEISDNDDGLFSVITQLKNLDDFYYLHSTNVSILSALMGSRLDFNEDIRTALGTGGLFHDIGLTSVSSDILMKVDKNDEDFDRISMHTHVGYKIVEKNPLLHELEKRILLLHHEKADGNGYPFGFDYLHYSDQVPREVRIVAIINDYVNMVLRLPGETPSGSRQALRALLNRVYAPYKKTYSYLPADFRDFIRALGFIVNGGDFFMQRGDLVRLETGEVAIIEEMNRLYPLNPRIRILKNSRLENLKRPVQVDMLKNYKSYIAHVFERSPKKDTQASVKD